MARTQPALRCIPDAARVARIFAETAETRVSEPGAILVEQTQRPAAVVAAE